MNNISKNQINYCKIDESAETQRIDNFLLNILKGVPKSHIYRIIRSGEVRVNKKRVDASYKLNLGDELRIPPIRIASKEETMLNIPSAIFPILYEDDYYLIINKPEGVACHGGSGVSFGVIEQLRQNLQYKFLELAHRLDRDTSGVLILAKKRISLVKLQELMKEGKTLKQYLALVEGKFVDTKRNVKLPLFKYTLKTGERRVRVDQDNGLFSNTIFEKEILYGDYSLVRATLKTGRTHQIRVHLQAIGFPIVGDDKYASYEKIQQQQKIGAKRMFLHATLFEFIHPITNETVKIDCPLPNSFTRFLYLIR